MNDSPGTPDQPVEQLRARLDAASLLPRGRWKELWRAAAREFAAPAWELLERLVADASRAPHEAAAAWLTAPAASTMPAVNWATWRAALEPHADRDYRELRTFARPIVAAVTGVADPARTLPLVLASFSGLRWRLPGALNRERWIDATPFARAAAVCCLVNPAWHRFRDGAFSALGRAKALPCETRGAMWLTSWADPTRVPMDWRDYAELHEPAAVGAMLAEELFFDSSKFPMRPALTRALCRIIRREDPWLERVWTDERGGQPLGPQVLERAVRLLPTRRRRGRGSESSPSRP